MNTDLVLLLGKQDIGARIAQFEKNESSLTKLEVGSGEGINNAFVERIAAALPNNTHCTELLMKGCNVSTDNAKTLATGLASNNVLKKLDLESNRIDPAGILAIVLALRSNTSLVEVRIQNQKSQFGNEAETAIADMMEVNTHIEKIPLTLKNGGARVRVNKYETRNREFNRRRKKGETIAAVEPSSSAPVNVLTPSSSSSAPSTSTATSAATPTSAASNDAQKKADADAAAKKKAEDDAAAAKKKAETDAAAAKKKAEDDAAAAKKKAEADVAVAKKKAEEEAAVAKKKADADSAATAKAAAEKEAAVQKAAASASADTEAKLAADLKAKAEPVLARIEATLARLGA